MVNAQADAQPSKAGNIATLWAHYMNRMPEISTGHHNDHPPLAQLGSASGLGPEGRRFKSCKADQIKTPGNQDDQK